MDGVQKAWRDVQRQRAALDKEQLATNEKKAALEEQAKKVLFELSKGCAKIIFELILKHAGHLRGGKTTGSLYSIHSEINKELTALAEHDKNYKSEFNKKQPYGLEIDDNSELRYYIQYLFGDVWQPGASLAAVLGKIVAQRSLPGNPLNSEGVKDGK